MCSRDFCRAGTSGFRSVRKRCFPFSPPRAHTSRRGGKSALCFDRDDSPHRIRRSCPSVRPARRRKDRNRAGPGERCGAGLAVDSAVWSAGVIYDHLQTAGPKRPAPSSSDHWIGCGRRDVWGVRVRRAVAKRGNEGMEDECQGLALPPTARPEPISDPALGLQEERHRLRCRRPNRSE